jgi:TIR domain
MTSEPPLLYVSGVASDATFVDHLAGRLTARGLEVVVGGELGEPRPIDARQHIIGQADLVLMVASHAGLRSSVVVADYRFALAQGRRVMPLIVEPLRHLPAELRDIQGVDFRQGEDAGWRDLLVALDDLGLARYPVPTPPQLDAEVVAARAVMGRLQPTWTVSRSYAAGRRRLSTETLYGSTMTLLLAAVAFFATARNPLVLVFALFVVYTLYTRLSPRVQRVQKDGRMVILTPDGIAVRTGTNVAWASYHEATVSGDGPADADTLAVIFHAGQAKRTLTMPLVRMLGRGMFATYALRAYHAYAAQYASGAERAGAASQSPASTDTEPPLVFISYARRDSALVDRLELSLRSAGYNTWVDRGNLLAGREWPPELQQALDRCAALIVAVSPDALRSDAVRREYTYTLGAGKPVLGALIRTT